MERVARTSRGATTETSAGGSTPSSTRKPASETVKNYEKDMSEDKVKMVESGDMYITTGSTLLDLALTGTRVQGGGIPGGIMALIYGPSGLGKSAILSEIGGSSQGNDGEVRFNDPEGRLDQEYAEIYGMSLEKKNYQRMELVSEVFDDIANWEPENKDTVNVYATDSLAALTTELEMSDKGDKMGMRRAKEFSAGLRKVARIVASPHKLLVCTNQIRQGDYGKVMPGGMALLFYSTIAMEVQPIAKAKNSTPYIIKNSTIGNDKKISKTIGININVKITKNTKNDPFREAPVCIVFGYGIDDIRANLQWLKDKTGATKYDCITESYQAMERAIVYIENNKLEGSLKKKVQDLWYEIENKLKTTRKKKQRG